MRGTDFHRSLLWGAALVVAGCGGGGGGGVETSSPAQNGGTEQSVGAISVRSTGALQPPVTAGGRNVIVTGLAGATFDSVRLSMPPATSLNGPEVNAMSQIVYSLDGNTTLLDLGTGRTSVLADRPSPYGNSSYPEIAPAGDRVYASVYDLASATFQLNLLNIDGTSMTKLTSDAGWATEPTAQNGQSRVAFVRNNDIWMWRSGTTDVQLTNDPLTEYSPEFSPDGTRIAYLKNNGSNTELWTMNNVGSSEARLSNLYVRAFAWLPDSKHLAVVAGSSASSGILVIDATTGLWANYNLDSTSKSQLSVAPDGRTLLYSHDGHWVKYDLFTRTETPYPTIPDGALSASWGPYVRERRYVGSGGNMGSAASGFLMAQSGRLAKGIVVFDSATRSASRIEKGDNSNPNQPNLAFIVTGGVSSLKYVNGPLTAPATAITSGLNAVGAVVTFSADSGEVTSVLPYGTSAESRGLAKPVQNPDGSWSGDFLAVYDADGKNLAEGGAKTVAFDGKGQPVVH